MNKSHPRKKGGKTVTQELCDDMEMSKIVLKIILNRKPNGKVLAVSREEEEGVKWSNPTTHAHRAVEHVLCFREI